MTSHRREELLGVITDAMTLDAGRIVEVRPGSHAVATRAPQPERPPTPRPTAAAASPDEFVLDLQNVTVALDEGATVVMRDVTWRMHHGEHWMLLGDNGAGKTSLLRLIMGDLWPAAGGRIDRFGQRGFADVWQIKRRIGYVSHELQARYHHDLTACQVVGTGFSASVGWLSQLSPDQEVRVDEVLDQLGLSALADRSLQRMSYGQARKVLVARALVHRPQLLILDEVFDGLDAQFRSELAALFDALAQDTSIILVSHHDGDALSCITHRMHIADGRAVLGTTGRLP